MIYFGHKNDGDREMIHSPKIIAHSHNHVSLRTWTSSSPRSAMS